jgi:4-alpha-glucanotransferase
LALERGGYLDVDAEGASEHDVLAGLVSYLGASRAQVVLVNVEDLWLETEPQNVPGTSSDERANFRRRLTRSIDDLERLAPDAPERLILARLDDRRPARGERA